jgi:predicted dehydrogenase
MVRIAIAGAGMVSAHHLRAWASIANARVVALADTDVARAERRATEFGIGAVYDDAARMLDAERPDALDIAAGHRAHGTLCFAAAERGIDILCQKPLAPTLSEARDIVAVVEPRVRLMVHENWRFRPWYRLAREWVEAGHIGTLRRLLLAARSSGLVARDGNLPALERQPILASVPRLMIGEVLVHHLDVARYLAGPLTVAAATTRREIDAVRGETMAHIALAADGMRAEVSGDLADPDAPMALTDTMHLAGTAGAIALDGGLLTLSGREARATAFDLDAGYQQSYDAAIAHFVDALVHDRPFETSPEVHLGALGLVEDAYRLAAG